ncbi:MAG: leucine--tRNA ligase [Armatimonadetes bacterium]|nr:leucine--tRNA ligase [Armatimonadota bacterium]
MPERYEPATFEPKWRQKWKEVDLFRTREDASRPKFYGLDFFPYPSGAGLSVGHCKNYVPTDVICRMKYMQGYNVLHPMGFDAFGLPAENEAIKRKRHPWPMIQEYGETYHRQMDLIGISYDWSRSFFSSEPSYYRWTQWLFKKLYEKDLAFRANAEVNWCPKDKTALANEEVVGGLCERCGTPVEKRAIPQWFFRITSYAQRLLDDLDDLNWPEGIKAMQRNWIGRSEGVEFEMRISGPGLGNGDHRVDLDSDSHAPNLTFRVFTTRIDTIFGMTFCVLAPEHPVVKTLLKHAPSDSAQAMEAYRAQAAALSDISRQAEGREKTGVFTGYHAINPATGKPVPIYLADYVLMGYGTGAIMAVPGGDQRDFDFATRYGIEIIPVGAPAIDRVEEVEALKAQGKAFESKDGVLINSGEYTGKSVSEAQQQLGEWIEALGIGERKVNYKLRDWLISRQRYWGCPIPVTYDKDGHQDPVPDDLLPVMLPDVENYEPTEDGRSPLAAIPDFVNTTGPDGTLARRETDTMGGFACSSWYFLRFCDPHNEESAWDKARADYWMPVDCYVGGAEHAVMHLLYARFWTKVFYDLGLVSVKEPFARLENQGQVLAMTPYRKPREGETLDVGDEGILISFAEAKEIPEEDLLWRWARMSKSKGNVVTPEEAVDQYGADALRVYELFVAPFDAEVQWSNEGMQGATRFLSRVFKLVSDNQARWKPGWKHSIESVSDPDALKIRRCTHQLILKVTQDVEKFAFNTAISSMMIFLNSVTDLLKSTDGSGELDIALSEALETVVLVLSPFAPFSADEIWTEMLGRTGFTYQSEWPQGDPELAKEDSVTIAVQVNGKLRGTFETSAGSTQSDLEASAKELGGVQAQLDGKTIRKVIVIPDKLVNIVAN